MASVQAIAKGKLIQMALKNILQVQPDLEITENYVRVYYPENKIPLAQSQFKKIMEQDPGEVRTDLAGVIAPYYLKKYSAALLGIGAAGFVIGKAFPQ